MVKKKALKLCRYCGKRMSKDRLNRHRCNERKVAYDEYARWREDHPIAVDEFATFAAWEIGRDKGAVPGYEHEAVAVANEGLTYGQPDMGNGSDTPTTDTPMVADGGGPAVPDGWAAPDLDSCAIAGGLDAKAPGPSLKTVIEAGKSVADDFRLSAHDRGWIIPVRTFHAALMWAAKAKERGTSWRLSKEEVKRLTHSLYASFGESPLSKLKVAGSGPFDEHIAGVAADVYLEWTLDNVEGFMERYADIQDKAERRKLKAGAMEVQG